MLGLQRVFAAGAVGQMRGIGREGFAKAGDFLAEGGLGLFLVDQMIGDSAGEDAVAGGLGPVGGAVGAAGFRALRDGDEEGRFGGGEAFGLFAEVRDGGGADAFEIAAIGRQFKIQR